MLENHHCSVTFKILEIKSLNILSSMKKPEFLIMRKFIINNILSTDMKRHFDILKQFDLKYGELMKNPSLS